MPRKPTNYTNTLIYKFVCKDLTITDLYVGHTTSFKDRKREHKSRCNKSYPFLIYKTINDNGGWDNWEMIEIEKFPCNDANEARARERYWYETLSANLNARSPTENIKKKKEREKNYLKQYNQTLTESQKEKKEKITNIWKAQYYSCECGSKILNACKTKHYRTKKHLNYVKEN